MFGAICGASFRVLIISQARHLNRNFSPPPSLLAMGRNGPISGPFFTITRGAQTPRAVQKGALATRNPT